MLAVDDVAAQWPQWILPEGTVARLLIAAGAKPNKADGFSYAPEDVVGDGTHPSQSGREKVAVQLLNFFTSDANAKPWFVKKG